METFFLVQAFVMKSLLPIPVLANFFYFLHLCLLYALYSFEYKWFNMGWDVTKRLAAVESSWPYYFGFGIPLAFCSGGVPSLALHTHTHARTPSRAHAFTYTHEIN